jgi:hypothetical protein
MGGRFVNRPYKLQNTAMCGIMPPNVGGGAFDAPQKERKLYDKNLIRLPWHYLNDVLKASENAYFWRKWCKTDALKFDFSAIQKFYYKFTTYSSSDMT